METIICIFNEIGCAGEEPWQHSPLYHWYFGHVAELWRWIIPYLPEEMTGSSGKALFFLFAYFLYGGYWLAPLVVFWVWRKMHASFPEITKTQAAWFIFKWFLIAGIVMGVGMIVLLGFCIPLVAKGVARPAITHRMRW